MRELPRLATLLVVASAAVSAAVGLGAGPASAHNSLVSSDPEDGAELPQVPEQIVWTFDKAVPLDTMTVTLIDATGVRTELTGSSHGAAGDTEVVTPLPVVEAGPISLRWRLVGPDGHPITGRVDLTITPASVSSTVFTTVPATASTTVAPLPVDSSTSDGSFSTPSLLRWLLRYGSYLAMMAVVGILLTSVLVWSGTMSHPLLRTVLSRSLVAVAVLALLQLLVVASDISGHGPWASFDSVEAATGLDVGLALCARIALAVGLWLVLFRQAPRATDVYWTAVCLAGLGLLATWAWAGHSRSMRWPVVGVTTDVVHHAAAAGWVAGLAIVGWVVIPLGDSNVVRRAVANFSQVALVSVILLVVTGAVQSLRLVGSPADLLADAHGRYLALKLVALAAMLAVAYANRRRVGLLTTGRSETTAPLAALRRAVLTEFAVGLAIIGITAAMVVSPPTTGRSADTAEVLDESS